MELRQLEQFVAVAEERHFTRAAARCRVAVSALSAAIRNLESNLGVPLLLRTTRSVNLTDAGSRFLVAAREVLAAAAAARKAAGDVRDLLSGSLRVGGIATFDLLDQAAYLNRMRQAHPGLTIRYERDTSTALLEQVRTGRLDVAVLSLPEPAPVEMTIKQIAVGDILIACRRDHRLATRSSVGYEELARETFVGTRPGSRGHDCIKIILDRAGAPFDVAYEVEDPETLLDFLEMGLGVGVVIGPAVARRPALHTLTLADPPLFWTLAAVAPPAGQITPAARAFLDLIDTAVSQTPHTVR
jgi:DNA-binding transcriptional LysR family regulator